MNWNELNHGKPIQAINFPDGSGVRNNIECDTGLALIFEYSYHGEYDESWVCQLDKNGKEIRRFNVRYIESIEWLN